MKSFFPTIILVFALASCGFQEEQKSLYDQERLGFKPVTIQVQTKVDMTKVEPALPRQWCGRVLGWFPGVCGLFSMPLNFVRALIPPLPFKDRTPIVLPDNVPWTDPQILPYIQSVKVVKGSIRVVPEKERGPFYKKEKCIFLCGKEELDFLKEIEVRLVFSPENLMKCRKKAKELGDTCRGDEKCEKHAREIDEKCIDEHEKLVAAGKERPEQIVPIAKATVAAYDKKKKEMAFTMTNKNLRPYLEEYTDFDVDIKAKGKFPKRATYMDGSLTLEFVLQLPDPY
jgi:hypothetical protein